MTAPDARQSDELRGLIAEALPYDMGPIGFRHRDTGELTGYGVALVVDHLLPAVTAWHEKAAEAQARARAAEAWDEGFDAGYLYLPDDNRTNPHRAAALAADDRTDPA